MITTFFHSCLRQRKKIMLIFSLKLRLLVSSSKIELERMCYFDDNSSDLKSLHSYLYVCEVLFKYNTAIPSFAAVEQCLVLGELCVQQEGTDG
jgi:hypothetical protein